MHVNIYLVADFWRSSIADKRDKCVCTRAMRHKNRLPEWESPYPKSAVFLHAPHASPQEKKVPIIGKCREMGETTSIETSRDLCPRIRNTGPRKLSVIEWTKEPDGSVTRSQDRRLARRLKGTV